MRSVCSWAGSNLESFAGHPCCPVGDHGQPEVAAEGTGTDPISEDNRLDQRRSVWEIAIKYALGRGDMPVSSQDAVSYFNESGYRFLAIEAERCGSR